MYDHLKGFRDFYPEEMAARRAVFETLEGTARRYGFREVGTPALERAQLYIDKSGEEIAEQLYAFTDRGGREVALAPELTPTVARMVVARAQALSKPIKWYSTRPFWRYEQVQQGRFREFYQTNVDVFGSAEPEADAEVLACAADAMTGLGLESGDFEFRLSHRDLLGGLLAAVAEDVDVRAAIRAVDKRARLGEEEYSDLLVEAGLSRNEAQFFDELLATDDLAEVAEAADSPRVDAAVAELEAVLEAVEAYGASEHCVVSLETARGLEYYTGVVFECFDASGAVGRSIFGGGRYDELIEDYGGQPTPAVGFAVGDATLEELLRRADAWSATGHPTDYYVLQAGDTRAVAASIVRDLRERGNVVETDISGRSFGSQLEYADSIAAETVVIVGERDLEHGDITVKDMATGEQTAVSLEAFPGDHDRPTYGDFA